MDAPREESAVKMGTAMIFRSPTPTALPSARDVNFFSSVHIIWMPIISRIALERRQWRFVLIVTGWNSLNLVRRETYGD